MDNGSSGGKAVILVVDDDPTVGLLVRSMVEHSGCLAEEAQNGDEALNAVSSLHPALVLLDVMMPGIDGFAVCRELRRTGYLNPVILMSGDIGPDIVTRGREAGATDILGKPFGLAELRNRLHDALGKVRADHTSG